MSVSPTPSNAAHLLRRAAWGGRPDEIERVVDDGIETSVARLFDAMSAPPLVEPRRRNGYSPYDDEAVISWFVQHCATSPAPAIERLMWFWHGHFATSASKVEFIDLMLRQFATLRRYCLGRFDDLLNAMVLDGAMNLWLDLESSIAGSPNENFARELLELFSMGASNGYTQRDVVEAARAFTGYGLASDPRYARPVDVRLVPGQHDFGSKTFLGRSGNFDGADIVSIVVERPECHRFVAERFWLRYAGTTPEPAVIDRLAAAFAARLRIHDLVTEMFTDPAFYTDEVKGGLVSQPVETVIRTVRGFELPTVDLTAMTMGEIDEREDELVSSGLLLPYTTLELMETMGQLPMFPPNVAGWPHNEPWLDSNRSAGRLLAGTELGHLLAELELPVGDELRSAASSGAGALTARLMARFGRESWTPETEAAIAAALGDDAETGLAAAIAVAFTSPEVTLS